MVDLTTALTLEKSRKDHQELLEKIHTLEIRVDVLANTSAKTNKLLKDLIKVVTLKPADKKNSSGK